jgi:hypothetical protein
VCLSGWPRPRRCARRGGGLQVGWQHSIASLLAEGIGDNCAAQRRARNEVQRGTAPARQSRRAPAPAPAPAGGRVVAPNAARGRGIHRRKREASGGDGRQPPAGGAARPHQRARPLLRLRPTPAPRACADAPPAPSTRPPPAARRCADSPPPRAPPPSRAPPSLPCARACRRSSWSTGSATGGSWLTQRSGRRTTLRRVGGGRRLGREGGARGAPRGTGRSAPAFQGAWARPSPQPPAPNLHPPTPHPRGPAEEGLRHGV